MKLSNYPAELRCEALEYFRSLLFTAKRGKDAYEIIENVFTEEERYAIGRRLQIADWLMSGASYLDIQDQLKTTNVTIGRVARRLGHNPEIFEKIIKRYNQDIKEIRDRSYSKVGGGKKAIKETVRTGFTDKDLTR